MNSRQEIVRRKTEGLCHRNSRLTFMSFFWLLNLLLLPNMSHGEEAAITMAAQPSDSVLVMEPFRLTIQVVAPNGTQVTFPDVAETLGVFDVIRTREQFDIPSSDGTIRSWTRTIELEGIQPGNWPIDGTQVQVKYDTGLAKTLTANSISIKVRASVPAEADVTKFEPLTDVQDLANENLSESRWLYAWVALGVVALGILFVLFRKKKTRRLLGSQQWLAQRLARLKKLDANTEDLPIWQNEFYEELTLITSEHLATHCGLTRDGQSPSRTTQHLRNHGIRSETLLREFQNMLLELDQVKFGFGQSTREKRQGWCDTLQKIMTSTAAWARSHTAPKELDFA